MSEFLDTSRDGSRKLLGGKKIVLVNGKETKTDTRGENERGSERERERERER